MTVLLFLLLSRVFPIYIACIVIVSMFYYQSNVAFTTSNFMTFLGLFALASTLLISKYFSGSGKSWRVVYLFLAGLFSVFTFLTKQSDGLYILAFSFLAVAIASYVKEGFCKGIRNISVFLVGIIVPLLYVFVWLDVNGALNPFWSQVFVGASSAKGGVITMLFAWIPQLLTVQNAIILLLVAFIIYILRVLFAPQGFRLERVKDGSDANPKSNNSILVRSCCMCALCFNTILECRSFQESKIESMLNFIRFNLLVVDLFIGLLVLFGIYLVRMFKDRKSNYFSIFIIATISLGIALGNTPSAGLGNFGGLIGVGLVIGFLASIPSYYGAIKIFIFIFCIFLSMYLVSSKYVQPYAWWGITQPDIRTTSSR